MAICLQRSTSTCNAFFSFDIRSTSIIIVIVVYFGAMSGYRSLHRQQLVGCDESVVHDNDDKTDSSTTSNDNTVAIWCIGTTPLLLNPNSLRKRRNNISSSSASDDWRIWIGCSDGYVRTYNVQENSSSSNSKTTTTTKSSSTSENGLLLDASVFSINCTHHLVGVSADNNNNNNNNKQSSLLSSSSSELQLGCTRLSIVRNYIGDDTNVGDIIIATLNLAGLVRIFQFNEDWDNTTTGTTNNEQPKDDDAIIIKEVHAVYEFVIKESTGTTLCIQQPTSVNNNIFGGTVIILAIGCLDGTISLVSTGIVIYQGANVSIQQLQTDVPPPGTILSSLGRPGSSIPLSLVWKQQSQQITSSVSTIAVGRQDGTIDVFTFSSTSTNNNNDNESLSLVSSLQQYRLNQLLGHPVRGLDYTIDGQLLIGGNDNGTICLWDSSRDNSINIGDQQQQQSQSASSSSPVLVHHILKAHNNSNGWIVNILSLNDSRRFVSLCYGDESIRIWKLGQSLNQQQPIHSFHLDNPFCWTVQKFDDNNNNSSLTTDKKLNKYLISGSENGWIQIFSLE